MLEKSWKCSIQKCYLKEQKEISELTFNKCSLHPKLQGNAQWQNPPNPRVPAETLGPSAGKIQKQLRPTRMIILVFKWRQWLPPISELTVGVRAREV